VLAALGGAIGCGVQFINPRNPPENLKGALLYYHKEGPFWVKCDAFSEKGTNCDFWQLDGQTRAFSCRYQLTEALRPSDMAHISLGSHHELDFDHSDAIPCEVIQGSN
jgi:hypothetical protein